MVDSDLGLRISPRWTGDDFTPAQRYLRCPAGETETQREESQTLAGSWSETLVPSTGEKSEMVLALAANTVWAWAPQKSVRIVHFLRYSEQQSTG